MSSRNPRVSWLMLATMIAVTLWSCATGGHGPGMMLIAAIGTLALIMLLDTIAAALPPHRIIGALFAGAWILLLVPAWDWLEGRYHYPESLASAAVFAVGFALLRLFLTPPNRPGRPPR